MPSDDPYADLIRGVVGRDPQERVRKIARRSAIPDDIAEDYLRTTKIESGHNVNVRDSPKGAQGFGQVMPDTPGGTTRTVGNRRYNLRNPDENIEAGLRYFAEGGDDPVRRRLYYFGGPGAARTYDKTGRIPNISDGLMTAAQYVKATGANQSPRRSQQQPTADDDEYTALIREVTASEAEPPPIKLGRGAPAATVPPLRRVSKGKPGRSLFGRAAAMTQQPRVTLADVKRAEEQPQAGAGTYTVDPRLAKGEQPSDPQAYARAQELVGRTEPRREVGGIRAGERAMQARTPSLLERAVETVKEYAPGIRSLDTPMGIKTDALRGAASLGLLDLRRDIGTEEKLIDPQAEGAAETAYQVGAFAPAVVPYVAAGKLVSKIPALTAATREAHIARSALTFGGVELGREVARAAQTGEPLNPQEVAISTAIGAGIGGLAGVNPGLKKQLVAFITPGVVADVARGTDPQTATFNALTNLAFGLHSYRSAPREVQAAAKAASEQLKGEGRERNSRILSGDDRVPVVDSAVAERTQAPMAVEGVTREIQTEAQPTIETQPAGEKPRRAIQTPIPETSEGTAPLVTERTQPIAERPAETGQTKSQWQHRDFGLVSESPNQSGVGRGRVRVTAEDGSEHVIQRSNLRGEGNNLSVPVKESQRSTWLAPHLQADIIEQVRQPSVPDAPRGFTRLQRAGASGDWIVGKVEPKPGEPVWYRDVSTKELAAKHGYMVRSLNDAEANRLGASEAKAYAAKESQSKPPQSPAKGGGKQAWEMTRRQFVNARVPARLEGIVGRNYPGKQSARANFAIIHKQRVEIALSEGKPVPPEVLRDYPDLQPPTSGGQKPPPKLTEAEKQDDVRTIESLLSKEGSFYEEHVAEHVLGWPQSRVKAALIALELEGKAQAHPDNLWRSTKATRQGGPTEPAAPRPAAVILTKEGAAQTAASSPAAEVKRRSREEVNDAAAEFEKANPNTMWHGSPSGDLRGGAGGLHIGTRKAATQALEARIGVPAEGTWDGTREYGKTLLAGKQRLREIDPDGNNITGFNVDAPEGNYYPTQKATYGDKSLIALDSKPEIFPVRIKGRMSNSPDRPHDDFKAEGRMRGQLKRGTAKSGYYYKNVGEDAGSISAVLPSASHIERLEFLSAARSKRTPPLTRITEPPPARVPPLKSVQEPPPSTTSARKAQFAGDRAELDLPQLPPAGRKSWRESLAQARPEAANRLADEVLAKPRALSDSETASVVVRAQQVKNEHAVKMAEIGAATDPETITRARNEAQALEAEFDKLTTAAKASGTEKGRTLAAQKLTINQDFDLVSVVQRMKAAKGRELNAGERTRYEQMVKERDAAIQQRDAALERARTAQIQKNIERAQRQRQRAETKEALDAEAAAIKQQIAAEFARLKSQASSVQSMAGLGNLDPEGVIARNLLHYARNRVKANVGIKAEALIDEVHGLVSDFADRRQIAELISGYKLAVSEREPENVRRLREIRSEIQTTLKAIDIEAGVRSPRREGPTRGEARALPMEGPRKSEATRSGQPLQGPRPSEASKLPAEGPRLSEGVGKQQGPQLGPRQGPQKSEARQLPAAGPSRHFVSRNEQRLKFLQAKEAELTRRIEEGDFSKPERAEPLPYTRAVAEQQRRVEEIERRFAREEYRATRSAGGRISDELAKAANVPKTIKSIGDISAVFRQGGYLAITHPIQGGVKPFRDMIRAFTDAGYRTVNQKIQSDPAYETLKRAGTEFTGVEKDNPRLNLREEGYLGSEYLNYIPIAKQIKNFSENTFVSFLDAQRLYVGKTMLDGLANPSAINRMLGAKGGLSRAELADSQQRIARLLNSATGRGNLGVKGNQIAPVLNIAMFSPRLLKSRIELLNNMFNPVAVARMPRNARAQIVKDNVKFLAATAAVLSLAKAAGAEVNLDPDDGDYLKIRVGATTYDTLTGLQQPFRYIANMSRAGYARLRGDETYAGKDMWTLTMGTRTRGGFLESKASPIAGAVVETLRGSDFLGRKRTIRQRAVDIVSPLIAKDFYEAVKQEGLIGLVKAAPAATGIGVTSYPKPPEKPTTQAEKLARKLIGQRMPDVARTDEEIESSRAVSELRARSRRGEDVTAEIKTLPERQQKSIVEAKGQTRLQQDFKRLGLENALTVWNVATEAERAQIKPMLADKADNVDNLDPSKQESVKAQLRAIGIVPVEELPAERQAEIRRARRSESREQSRERRQKPRQRPSRGYGY